MPSPTAPPIAPAGFDAPGKQLATSMGGQTPVQAVGAMRVLLVDDSSAVRSALKELLTSMAPARIFEVVGEAGTGEMGVSLAADERPDLVILDVEMPVMGGLVALPYIRRAAPAARVIVFSGSESKEEAIQLGATAFVPKGDAADLIAAIDACCSADAPAGMPVPSEAGNR